MCPSVRSNSPLLDVCSAHLMPCIRPHFFCGLFAWWFFFSASGRGGWRICRYQIHCFMRALPGCENASNGKQLPLMQEEGRQMPSNSSSFDWLRGFDEESDPSASDWSINEDSQFRTCVNSSPDLQSPSQIFIRSWRPSNDVNLTKEFLMENREIW